MFNSKNLLAYVLLALVLGACTNEPEAWRVLNQDGVDKIRFTGYQWFACSESDWYHTGFTGKRNGKQISGVVCTGLLFKSSTIRY